MAWSAQPLHLQRLGIIVMVPLDLIAWKLTAALTAQRRLGDPTVKHRVTENVAGSGLIGSRPDPWLELAAEL